MNENGMNIMVWFCIVFVLCFAVNKCEDDQECNRKLEATCIKASCSWHYTNCECK